jgi:cysteine-rich repeat protein
VKLTTAFGDSDWQGVPTMLIHGVITICGDGVAHPPEECDGGGESATCDADCTRALCGDGTLNPTAGEFCDDGNNLNGDGCSTDCVVEPGDCSGDTNADSAVDLTDYEALHHCISGPGSTPNPAGGLLGFVECLWFFDCSADGDVDLNDVAAFQMAFTGPH